MQVILQVVTERIPLQVIVVQGEQRESCNDYQRGGQQDLVAEPEVFDHVCLRPVRSGTSLYGTRVLKKLSRNVGLHIGGTL
ncbi:hypothetical protein D9M68_823310 [compost metagenome]